MMFGLVLNAIIVLLLCASAVIDARIRSFPNQLFLVLLILACLRVYVSDGGNSAFMQLAISFASTALLFAFELLWRKLAGQAGLGMGDVKAFFVISILSPTGGIVSFALGLLLMALTCVAARKHSLPLLPFVFPAFVVIHYLLHLV